MKSYNNDIPRLVVTSSYLSPNLIIPTENSHSFRCFVLRNPRLHTRCSHSTYFHGRRRG